MTKYDELKCSKCNSKIKRKYGIFDYKRIEDKILCSICYGNSEVFCNVCGKKVKRRNIIFIFPPIPEYPYICSKDCFRIAES